jgi:hypothetical protein
MTPRLPGLPTISALMLAAIITAALGLWGTFDLTKLKEWQTLLAAVIAPSIAICAAWIAYKAAMAKVEHDREEGARRRNSERLGLFLRLRAALRQTLSDAGQRVTLIERQSPKLAQQIVLTPAHLKIYNPPSLAEAWESINLVPPSLIGNIEGLRRLIPLIEEELARFPEQKWEINFVPFFPGGLPSRRIVDDYLTLHAERCQVIQIHCEKIIGELDQAIPDLQSRFDES